MGLDEISQKILMLVIQKYNMTPSRVSGIMRLSITVCGDRMRVMNNYGLLRCTKDRNQGEPSYRVNPDFRVSLRQVL